ncbi:hypothetical protein QBC43DRAFT_339662 [Cladorrhinum sp. PSN259]|nr:hypothetical protein QBC43DRAFT_339662 [Cladorrhinum sp. PSN259]
MLDPLEDLLALVLGKVLNLQLVQLGSSQERHLVTSQGKVGIGIGLLNQSLSKTNPPKINTRSDRRDKERSLTSGIKRALGSQSLKETGERGTNPNSGDLGIESTRRQSAGGTLDGDDIDILITTLLGRRLKPDSHGLSYDQTALAKPRRRSKRGRGKTYLIEVGDSAYRVIALAGEVLSLTETLFQINWFKRRNVRRERRITTAEIRGMTVPLATALSFLAGGGILGQSGVAATGLNASLRSPRERSAIEKRVLE